MEQKIQHMIENLVSFGIDVEDILAFSDFNTLEEIHNAIEEYRKNKNGSQTSDSIW
ncbi:MAG: hypothetical protein K5793_00655 [Nitrosarchaeum sp.]|nr:hypothetical protein [Nitrosarchaeum sp.]